MFNTVHIAWSRCHWRGLARIAGGLALCGFLFAGLAVPATITAHAAGPADCGPGLQTVRFLPRGDVAPGAADSDSRAVATQNSGQNDAAIFLTPDEIEDLRKNSACKQIVRQLVELRNEMRTGDGVSTDFYDLRLIPTDELIKDQKGSYYALYLKDARRRRRFQYPGGRYVLKRVDTRFRASLTQFVRDVLAKVHGGVEYKLYVRGSASSKPMRRKRKQARSYPFETITYHPQVGEDLYDANQEREVSIEKRYGNEELPYLRAAFMKQVVQNYFPLTELAMLESTVAETKSKSAQFAEVIMFIDWE